VLSASPDRRRKEGNASREISELAPDRGETDEITTAVSKLATTPTGGNGELAGKFTGASAAREAH